MVSETRIHFSRTNTGGELLRSVEQLSTAVSNFSTTTTTTQPVPEIKNNLVTALNRFAILFKNETTDNDDSENDDIDETIITPVTTSIQETVTPGDNSSISVTNQAPSEPSIKDNHNKPPNIAKVLKHQWSSHQLKVLVKWSGRPF